jgi:hypothetical protein
VKRQYGIRLFLLALVGASGPIWNSRRRSARRPLALTVPLLVVLVLLQWVTPRGTQAIMIPTRLAPASDSVASAEQPLAEASLFLPLVQHTMPDPLSTWTWRETSPTHYARGGSEAVLLPSGSVLVVGGSHMEQYDPTTASWSVVAELPPEMANPTATLLLNGKVLITGMGSSAFLYDPTSQSLRVTAPMAGTRYSRARLHTATLLGDGRVLIAGGGDLTSQPTDAAEVYDPASDTWQSTGSMTTPRILLTTTLLPDGRVLAIGSTSPGASTAELYDPQTGLWRATASLSTYRTSYSATLLPDGQVLVLGGSSEPTAELFDPVAESWRTVGGMPRPRHGHQTTLLPDGRVLVTGGHDGDPWMPVSHSVVEAYDPATHTWSRLAPLHIPRAGHRATGLVDGRVLVTGGVTVPNYPVQHRTSELFAP